MAAVQNLYIQSNLYQAANLYSVPSGQSPQLYTVIKIIYFNGHLNVYGNVFIPQYVLYLFPTCYCLYLINSGP